MRTLLMVFVAVIVALYSARVVDTWRAKLIISQSSADTPTQQKYVYDIHSWWPVDATELAGTQPFKALVIPSRPLSEYSMYWKVENGSLHLMNDSYSDYPHKEVWVNMDTWSWKSGGTYLLSFIAKDNKTGEEIAKKNVVVKANVSSVPQNNSVAVIAAVAAPFIQMQPTITPSAKPTVASTLAPVHPVPSGLPTGQATIGAVPASVPTKAPSSALTVTFSFSPVPFISAQASVDKSPKPSATLVATATSQPTPSATPSLRASPLISLANPFLGANLYIDPHSNPKKQAEEWKNSRPHDAEDMHKLASQPWAVWLGEWSGNVTDAVRRKIADVESQGSLPVFIAYNIPQRDCGSYSAGGANNYDSYRGWIQGIAEGIANHKAVVVLEPDAISGITCLSEQDQEKRYATIADAVKMLKGQPNASVYIDAGNMSWVSADEMATRLKRAGVEKANGFSLNISNFFSNEDNVKFGTDLSNKIGGGKHFIVDTSRNGLGATSDKQWCNPSGRAIGKQTLNTGHELVDAFLWLKAPGESDGTCNGGPSAGTWWPEYALGLVQRAKSIFGW